MPTPGSNQFLPFAIGSGSNVLAPADYAALAAVSQGFQSGIAKSKEVNTPLRQATFVAASMAQIIANTGVNVNDDGNMANFISKFLVALQSSVTAPGQISWFAMATAPSGFLTANGASISRTTYANLYSAIGTTFGAGDGSTTFAIPDLRGMFIRGWDNGRGTDPSRAFGSTQASAFGQHNHTASVNDPTHSHGIYDAGHSHGVNDPGHSHDVYDPGHTHAGGKRDGGNDGHASWYETSQTPQQHTWPSGTGIGIYGSGSNISINGSGTGVSVYGNSTGITVSIANTGSSETRPINIALLPCIKY